MLCGNYRKNVQNAQRAKPGWGPDVLDTMSLARENFHWLSCTRENMYDASL